MASKQTDKVECIVNWNRLVCVTDVRAFLGITGFYRKWIRNYASIAAPLTRLLEKNCQFEWTPDCQDAFETLKQKLMSSDVLAFPRDEGMFILDTDASGTGVGAVLSQLQWEESLQQEVERPIAYASRSISKANASIV